MSSIGQSGQKKRYGRSAAMYNRCNCRNNCQGLSPIETECFKRNEALELAREYRHQMDKWFDILSRFYDKNKLDKSELNQIDMLSEDVVYKLKYEL